MADVVSFDKIKHKKKMATEDIVFTVLNTTFLVLFAVLHFIRFLTHWHIPSMKVTTR